MFGILLVGLFGLLVVAVVMPMVLWSLSMETLRQRHEGKPAPSVRLSLVPRQAMEMSGPSSVAA